MKNKETIAKRQSQEKKLLLEQLQKMPIIQVACDRAQVGRTTYYRWYKEDSEFNAAANEALRQGEELITELSESQLVGLIKEKHFSAIHLWLRSHHPKYSERLEILARVKHSDDTLTAEQEALVEEALGRSFTSSPDKHGKV